MLLADGEVLEEHYYIKDNFKPESEENDLSDTYFQLSTQALTGQFSPKTLQFKGFIDDLSVMVLVDTDITHNILQPHIAHHLNL